MKWKPIIFTAPGVVIVVLLLLPQIDIFWLRTQNDVITQIFKDHEIYSVIQSPQSVTAQRLHPKYDSSETLDGYTSDAPVALSPQQIQAIQNLLEKPSSYHWGVAPTCIPKYGVLLNFYMQRRTVRVALCFRCNQMGVFEGTDDSAHPISGDRFIDHMRPQLAGIVKEIFPSDKEIQELK